jgi:hypothetical protein
MTPCIPVEVHGLLSGVTFQKTVFFVVAALRVAKSTDLLVSSEIIG